MAGHLLLKPPPQTPKVRAALLHDFWIDAGKQLAGMSDLAVAALCHCDRGPIQRSCEIGLGHLLKHRVAR